jgi:four helix bundle protein
MGSAAEAEYHVVLAKDLGYVDSKESDAALRGIQEIKRMLSSLLKTARAKSTTARGHGRNTEN